ncbi:hypothetical protein TRV_00410 [Trichophyton verrucosum HKI 0517]|uniref:Uncharacterized protein n=1 Tax=Trichophyton verrucosum (strain HKI 0517) TaxID=663202 RepID=D4D016_TRIVH|nr:uncharacterized protein TRV_00410 [Trichophyton verrucosum HKI 0517]EFE44809.1 hypothetical protein TRV_00410 [Trichophyton verrucosum HKI 0517]
MRGEEDAEDDCNRPDIEEVVSHIPAMKQHCLDISPHGGWHFDPKNAVSHLYDSRVDIVDVFSSVDRVVAVEPSRVFDIFKLNQERIHNAKTSYSGLQGTMKNGGYGAETGDTLSKAQHLSHKQASYRLWYTRKKHKSSAMNDKFSSEVLLAYGYKYIFIFQSLSYHHHHIQSPKGISQTATYALTPSSSSNKHFSHLQIPYQPANNQQINKQTTSHLARMAAIVLALGAAIYITAEKIQDHREKKRALKAKNATKQAVLEDDDSVMAADDLPAYKTEKPPAYDFEQYQQQQHPTLASSKLMESSSQRYYIQARST